MSRGNVKKYYLIGVSGFWEGKRFAIVERAVIGRDKEKCNIVFPLNYPGVSGIHCEIKLSGKVMAIKDCDSTHGTFIVNGSRLMPGTPHIIQNGDRFKVGAGGEIFEVRY